MHKLHYSDSFETISEFISSHWWTAVLRDEDVSSYIYYCFTPFGKWKISVFKAPLNSIINWADWKSNIAVEIPDKRFNHLSKYKL